MIQHQIRTGSEKSKLNTPDLRSADRTTCGPPQDSAIFTNDTLLRENESYFGLGQINQYSRCF